MCDHLLCRSRNSQLCINLVLGNNSHNREKSKKFVLLLELLHERKRKRRSVFVKSTKFQLSKMNCMAEFFSGIWNAAKLVFWNGPLSILHETKQMVTLLPLNVHTNRIHCHSLVQWVCCQLVVVLVNSVCLIFICGIDPLDLKSLNKKLFVG